jgi:hypothetical protein
MIHLFNLFICNLIYDTVSNSNFSVEFWNDCEQQNVNDVEEYDSVLIKILY